MRATAWVKHVASAAWGASVDERVSAQVAIRDWLPQRVTTARTEAAAPRLKS